MATAREPSGVFPLDSLKHSEPTERVGSLYRWRSRGRININGSLVNVTLEAQESAIKCGSGSFNIEIVRGRGRLQTAETWAVMSNVHPPDAKEKPPKTPLMDLYKLRATGETVLLPGVPATKVARVYPDRVQLFSPYQEKFNLFDVMGVLATINRVAHSIARSSRNMSPAPQTIQG